MSKSDEFLKYSALVLSGGGSHGAFGAGFLRVGTSFDGFDEFSRPTGEASYSESPHCHWTKFRRKTGKSTMLATSSRDPRF